MMVGDAVQPESMEKSGSVISIESVQAAIRGEEMTGLLTGDSVLKVRAVKTRLLDSVDGMT